MLNEQLTNKHLGLGKQQIKQLQDYNLQPWTSFETTISAEYNSLQESFEKCHKIYQKTPALEPFTFIFSKRSFVTIGISSQRSKNFQTNLSTEHALVTVSKK